MTRALMRTAIAVSDAVRDARRAFGVQGRVVAALLALGALVPVFVRDTLVLDGLAATLYLALAASGLAFAVGLAGMPSLAQGAFVGIGAVCGAQLRVHGDLDPLLAGLGGAGAALLAGAVVGAGVFRLRPAFVAVCTWVVSWVFLLALLAFPDLAGGARGLVVPSGAAFGVELTPAVHFELALGLIGLALLAFAALARGTLGAGFAALRQQPAAAGALGVPAPSLRLAAFALSAAIGGLAGGLDVQLAGIADPGDYDAFLSFTLLVAVLLGGARTASGAVVGTFVFAAILWLADRLGALGGLATGRLDTLVAAVLLLYVVAVGGEDVVDSSRRWVIDRLRSGPARLERPGFSTPPQGGPRRGPGPTLLSARGLTKRFGEVVGLEDLSLDLAAGTVTALIGPNGSGKTTALRLLSGTLAPDSGTLLLHGKPLPHGGTRTHALAGVVRTLQPTAVFGSSTALENVLVGAGLRRRDGGVLRTLVSTPRARAGARAAAGSARDVLERFGLGWAAERRAAELPASDQRLLMIAAAAAASPRVLLVDEPSAGATHEDVRRLVSILGKLRDEGLALLVVEHNLRLVRDIADRVIVLEAGRVLAAGGPAEVAANPEVRAAYLGRRHDLVRESR